MNKDHNFLQLMVWNFEQLEQVFHFLFPIITPLE